MFIEFGMLSNIIGTQTQLQEWGLWLLKKSCSCLVFTVSPDGCDCSLLAFLNRNHNWHLYNTLDELASGYFTFNIKAGQNKCNYSTVMTFVALVHVLSYVTEIHGYIWAKNEWWSQVGISFLFLRTAIADSTETQTIYICVNQGIKITLCLALLCQQHEAILKTVVNLMLRSASVGGRRGEHDPSGPFLLLLPEAFWAAVRSSSMSVRHKGQIDKRLSHRIQCASLLNKAIWIWKSKNWDSELCSQPCQKTENVVSVMTHWLCWWQLSWGKTIICL